MANEGASRVNEAIAAVRKAKAFGCGSASANVLADEIERLRKELAEAKESIRMIASMALLPTRSPTELSLATAAGRQAVKDAWHGRY